MYSTVEDRRAARVLLVDQACRVLLFRGCDPARPQHKYWYSVGGGVEQGEDDREAACRELREEIQIHVAPHELVGPVWECDDEFGFAGRWLRQRQVYFTLLVREMKVDINRIAGQEAVDAHRWWSRAELESACETFYPTNLPLLLSDAP